MHCDEQVLELLEGVKIKEERWAMPEPAAGDDEGEDMWGFDDLDDDDDEEFGTPSPSSTSSASSTSTGQAKIMSDDRDA